MKILLHSHAFWPMVGGIESVSHTLATGWTARGHEVTVATEALSDVERPAPYRVARAPTLAARTALVRWSDVVFSNGASVRYAPLATAARRPFVWTHQGYQLQSIDGLGWVDDGPAPLDPWDSVRFHAQRLGRRALAREASKLWARRQVGHQVAAFNVSVSEHVARRQPLPRSRVIPNPVDLGRFEAARGAVRPDAPVTFLGRLVSEKGVADLLHGYAAAAARVASPPPLQIIGDGPLRASLEAEAATLGLSGRVTFRGSLVGEALVRAVADAGICVLPSAWEEAQGIVAVELLAAGKPLLVSATGGLVEGAGDACLTFPNCDRAALGEQLGRLLASPDLQRELVARTEPRLAHWKAQDPLGAYLELFTQAQA